MVEKSNRGGIYHSFYWYSKANNKYMKDYDKNKESSYLEYVIRIKIQKKHWNMDFLKKFTEWLNLIKILG